MIGAIVAVATVCVAGVSFAVSRRSDRYRIMRSIEIRAPRDRVFAFIEHADLWSTWLTADTASSGGAHGSGVGASYEWDATGKAGKGRLEVTELARLERVTIRAQFERPFIARNVNTFTLAGDATTTVTWEWDASIPAYVVKLMSSILGAERMFGSHFEAGLHKLKTAVEATPDPRG